MSGIKITDLPLSTTPLSGTEIVPLVQSGVTKQVSVGNLTDGRSINASSVTASSGVTVGAGTASAPSIIPSGDTNTGMWFPAADTIAWSTNGSERMRIGSDGNIGIGATSAVDRNINVVRNLTGSASAFGVIYVGAVQSDVTSGAFPFYSSVNTANAAFTTSINHFTAVQGTFGALSTVNGQNGFLASGSLIGATTNTGFFAQNTAAVTAGKTAYGFYSDIDTATGGGTTWAFYGAGTAPSRFGGNVGFNTTSFGASSNGVVAIGNAAAVPTGNPTGGGVLYVEAGALKYRGSSGTVTTIANA